MDQYSTEVYDLLLKMAAAFCLTNRYLDRILELAPNLSNEEISEAVVYAMSLMDEHGRVSVEIC